MPQLSRTRSADRSTTSAPRRRRAATVLAAMTLSAVTMTACSDDGGSGDSASHGTAAGSSNGSSAGGAAASSSANASHTAPAATIASDVAEGATVGLSQPIGVTVGDGATVSDVAVTDANGTAVQGRWDAATKTWIPAGTLAKARAYTVTATVKASDGATSTTKRRLTSASTGARTTGIYTVTPYTRQNVGNAQPVVLTFSQAVPQAERAAVAKRFTVTDTAGVQGAWRWMSPTRLDYRPKTFWPKGDTVNVTGNVQGMKIGDTWGAGTLTNTGFTVTSDLAAVYDPTTKTVTVTEGGKTIRTMKSGGGKKGFATPTGTLVVLGKQKQVRMTSCSTGISCTPGTPNYYDETISNAVQVTPSGVYLHAAPWDHQLGAVDSSHGCLHLSALDAAWFYERAIPGNLVTIKGSNNPVSMTNGETDWNLTWEQWIS